MKTPYFRLKPYKNGIDVLTIEDLFENTSNNVLVYSFKETSLDIAILMKLKGYIDKTVPCMIHCNGYMNSLYIEFLDFKKYANSKECLKLPIRSENFTNIRSALIEKELYERSIDMLLKYETD